LDLSITWIRLVSILLCGSRTSGPPWRARRRSYGQQDKVRAEITVEGWASLIVWIEAAAFLFAGVLHTGVRFAFLPAFFHDPQIVGATVVEGLCAAVLGASAGAIIARASRAWIVAVGAQLFAIIADIFGMIVIAFGFGPDSPFNFLFHRLGIAILLVVLAVILTRSGREALRRRAEPLTSRDRPTSGTDHTKELI